MLARACHAVRHFHDGLFGGGKVVAQIHQRGADIGKLALAGAHDVGKLCDSGRSLVCAQVLAGIAEVNHDAGEVGQMPGGDAQLTARRHDLVDLIGARRDLCGHALRRFGQLVKLGFGGINSLANRSEGRFKANGSLDCRCAEAQNGCGHDGGQRSACRRHFLADSVALFPEGFEVLARFRPCGLGRVQLLIGFFNLSAGGSDGSLGTVQRGFRVNHRIRSLPDFLRVVGLLGGCQLFFRAPQRILILLNALLLQAQLVIQQRQLGSETGHAGVHVLNARRGQLEPALGQINLLAEGDDGGLAGINGFPGSVPVGLCQTQGLIAPVDLRLCASDCRLRCVQLGGCVGHGIRRVLSGFLQRRILAGQLFDLGTGIAVFRFQRIQIGLGGNGGGVVLAEGSRIRPDLLRRRCDLFLERLLCGFRVGQPLRVIVLAGKALLQLVVRCRQCPLILCYCILLQRQAALQRRKLCGKAGGAAFKALHAGGCQLELALRRSDLLIDGLDVPGKIVRLQGQRHHKIAEGFSHQYSPRCNKKSVGDCSRFQGLPHLIDIGTARLLFLFFLSGTPCPDAEEPQHIHAVDLAHAPAAFQQAVIGGINEIGQRQD